jgi:hypothetical protein
MAKTPPHKDAPAPGHPSPGEAAPPEPDEAPTTAADAPEVLKEDGEGEPANPIWIQPPYGDVLIKGLAFQPRAPLIHIGGLEYSHVADHADGTWIYRSAR